MNSKEYNEKLKRLVAERDKLDEIYYDESDPYAFDGGYIMELHELAGKAIALAARGATEANND